MISKEFFVKVINELKELRDIYDDINNYEHEDLVFKILQEVFKDKENDWTGYYLYELDFGKKWCEGKVTDKEGNDIPLKTAEDLYNILIDNMS